MINKTKETPVVDAEALIGKSIEDLEKIYSVLIYKLKERDRTGNKNFEANIVVDSSLLYCRFDKNTICTSYRELGDYQEDKFRIEDYKNNICTDIEKQYCK